MFKINGGELQQVVSSLTKGAKRARLGENRVYISSVDSSNEVDFYFVGEELQVQKRISCEVSAPFAFATTVHELEVKVGALPQEEWIMIENDGEQLNLNWGRSSKIRMETVPEMSPSIEIPDATESVLWAPGKLQIFSRSLPSFAAVANSAGAEKYPVLRGLYFSKEETGEVLVRASNGSRAVTINAQGVNWFDGFFASIPTETISGLAEIFPNDSEVKVSINEGKTLLIFESGFTKAVTRLLVGDFPPIDKSYTNTDEAKVIWRVDRMELLNTTRRIKRLGGDKPVMVFKKEGTKSFVELLGVSIEQIGANVEGEEFQFAVHSDYLELCLTLYRTDEVLLCLKDKGLPLTVLCDGNDDIKALIAQVLIV
ncbi:hypothetical protein V6B14_23280 (plasmid) [Sporosarcina psychrophila]|uniref:hypothetical protein n=1 Tax=Sporosarcina psychrophila TaxID=1476 RepID=UPI0030D39650